MFLFPENLLDSAGEHGRDGGWRRVNGGLRAVLHHEVGQLFEHSIPFTLGRAPPADVTIRAKSDQISDS